MITVENITDKQITGENITDDQIRELYAEIATHTVADATEIFRAAKAIGVVGRWSPTWYRRRRYARARCAEILNARAVSKETK